VKSMSTSGSSGDQPFSPRFSGEDLIRAFLTGISCCGQLPIVPQPATFVLGQHKGDQLRDLFLFFLLDSSVPFLDLGCLVSLPL